VEAKFSRSAVGYDPDEVAERIQKALSDFEAELARREAVEKEILDNNDEMRLDVKRLQAEMVRYRDRERTVSSALAAAQAEARAIEQEAEENSAATRKEIMDKIAAERAQLAELRSLLERFRSSFDQLLVSYEVGLAPQKPGSGQVH
jgi:cell division septum initiation protein DivIVA